MKVLIFSEGWPRAIAAARYWEGTDYLVLIPGDAHRGDLSRVIPPDRIVCHAAVPPKAARAWALEHFARPAQGAPGTPWNLLVSDQVTEITGVHPALYGEEYLATRDLQGGTYWRKQFSHRWPAPAFLRALEATLKYAESEGAYLVGFSNTDNPHFRGGKHRPVGQASLNFCAWKYDAKYRWDHDNSRLGVVEMTSGLRETAEHLKLHGRVALNNWFYARAFERPLTAAQQDRLLAEYPGLFTPAGRTVKLGTLDPDEIDRWRKERGAI